VNENLPPIPPPVEPLSPGSPLETPPALQEMPSSIPAVPSGGYASAAGRARAAAICLGLIMLIDVVSILFGIQQAGILYQWEHHQPFSFAALAASEHVMGILGVLHIVMFVATVIAFLMWLHRAHRNLPDLGAQQLKFTPRSAVWWWFVPFANLYQPQQVVNEIWQGSDPQAPRVVTPKPSATAPLIQAWWAAWIIANLVAQWGMRISMKAKTGHDFAMAARIDLINDFLTIGAGVLAILVVRGITARQEARYARRDEVPDVVSFPVAAEPAPTTA
jgi:hypothetical protein